MAEQENCDIVLTPDDYRELSLFTKLEDESREGGLRYLPKFAANLDAVSVRHFSAEDVIWEQGDIGHTAFYILTRGDLERLAQTRPNMAKGWQRPEDGAHPVIAKVQFADALSPAAPVRSSPWWWPWGKRDPVPDQPARPRAIPSDAAADIDGETLEAPMLEGELFGELGCLEAQPRTAAVVVCRGWYMLEMRLNILAGVLKDSGVKKYLNGLYAERGLGLHLRKFSIFSDLGETEFAAIRDKLGAALQSSSSGDALDVSLIEKKHGEVICYEHWASDSMYIIRGGVVQVVQDLPVLAADDVLDFPGFCAALRDGQGQLRKKLWERLKPLHDFLQEVPPAQSKLLLLLDLLNGLVLDSTWAEKPEGFAGLKHSHENLADAHAKRKQVPGKFERLLLEALFPQLRRFDWKEEPLILAYRGRGEMIGEMGLVHKEPRSATCIAFVNQNSELEKVKLLRISAGMVEQLAVPGSALAGRLKEMTEAKRQETETIRKKHTPRGGPSETQSQRFQDLYLAQGQALMLIDLDCCTRCDECVRACVDTHKDGNSRLFLEGPCYAEESGARRNFLVPMTCRSCRNPVCMSNCPVDSIHRQHPKGNIVIEDWCIGCERCFRACPFGAIHMHEVGVIREGSEGWRFCLESAAAKGWQQQAFDDGKWRPGSTPFQLDGDFRARLKISDAGKVVYCFRRRFDSPSALGKIKRWRLRAAWDKATEVKFWLNGTAISGERKRPEGNPGIAWGRLKAKIVEVDLEPAQVLQEGNVLSVSVEMPEKGRGLLLDVGLYMAAAPDLPGTVQAAHALPIVTQKAVVCDLCASLDSGPACVNACPHDAAKRFDGLSGIIP